MTDEKTKGQLTPNSTITEMFNHVEIPDGMFNVLPITVSQDENDTRLAILIRGPNRDASIIMAKLMTEVDNLFDLLEQGQAQAEENKFVI